MEQVLSNINNIILSSSVLIKTTLIFCFSFLEGLPVIGSIFPGGTISLLVGVMSDKGMINPFYATAIITTGGFIGDMTGFLIGKKFKHLNFVKKIVQNEKHKNKWEFFDKQIIFISIIGRITPLVRSLPSLFAGARNINTFKYLIISLIGSFVWALGGVFGGNFLSKIAGNMSIPIIFGILFLTIIIATIKKIFK